MVFSSVLFIFLFLPITLILSFLARRELRNLVLLTASLAFYAWGEGEFVMLMLASVFFNYLLGIAVERGRERGDTRAAITLAVVFNLGLLAYFKYTGFFLENINALLTVAHIAPIKAGKVHMPIGISFFTFHSLSYIVDIYRGKVKANRSLVDISLYISLFPQLVAGPIIRYHDIAGQLTERWVTFEKFSYGARRFIIGMGKKVLIANTLAQAVDGVFSVPGSELTAAHAWLGAIGYTLQIYFDFSGYSDMAIGLGKMFGFTFLENFNYPYISRSIQEFWRRWHISLSNWFRDYLYFPLGGNRLSPRRTYINLFIVFLLTGFWHGASWTFIVWGLFHGTFLILERGGLKERLERAPSFISHLYAMSVVVIGWVFFRADNFPYAVSVIKAMVGMGTHPAADSRYPVLMYFRADTAIALALGIIFSTPLFEKFKAIGQRIEENLGSALGSLVPTGAMVYYFGVFSLSIALLATGTYNPFIYFRF